MEQHSHPMESIPTNGNEAAGLFLFTLIASLYALLHLPPEWLMAASTRMRRLEPALRKLAAWNRPGETESNPLRTLGAMAVTAGDWPDCPGWVKRIRSLLAVAPGESSL